MIALETKEAKAARIAMLVLKTSPTFENYADNPLIMSDGIDYKTLTSDDIGRRVRAYIGVNYEDGALVAIYNSKIFVQFDDLIEQFFSANRCVFI